MIVQDNKSLQEPEEIKNYVHFIEGMSAADTRIGP